MNITKIHDFIGRLGFDKIKKEFKIFLRDCPSLKDHLDMLEKIRVGNEYICQSKLYIFTSTLSQMKDINISYFRS
jgi:hypothetical protein